MRRRALVFISSLSLAVAGCSSSHHTGSATSSTAPVDLVHLVNPFMGTGVGGTAVGNINDSPAADLPFGMMQWGPDTSPHRAAGGGYTFGDTHVVGFSLTHMNGPGCNALGDVPILPVVGALPAEPEAATVGFTHTSEHAAPGQYAVTLASGVNVALGVTTRAGLGSFAFPGAAGQLLFKVADSEVHADATSVAIVNNHEITGTVTSGHFCDTGPTYHLSFDAQFQDPFTAVHQTAAPHATVALAFDTKARPTITMKVGISFVSVANARQNLAAEIPGWSLSTVQDAATATWNAALHHVDVQGGTPGEQATFASALYRSLLHPNVFSDVNGQYAGFDGHTHSASGYTQYANFSAWDTYRSQFPLVALIAGKQAGDMIASLLADEQQSGFLPKLPMTDGDSDQMNGDSADPIIAEAYTFGVRNFDAHAALNAMVKGATTPGSGLGWDVARQDLDEYLKQGWVEADRHDKTSFDYTIGGSETLEYAIDDDAIAQLATALGDAPTARAFTARAANWRHLFNNATGYLSARRADGSFPPGPAFQGSPLPGIGQDGWEEGNSMQYTWSVPQDLHGLVDLMGGNAIAVSRLDKFFLQLNTSRKQPYDWAGNEPALGIPWVYDYTGAPAHTQDVVRRIATQLYSATPNGEPGNDDLGAMASWYVWAAIGMYPETPGRADLVLASPMFTSVAIHTSGGQTLSIVAPGASDTNRYVQSLRMRGAAAPPYCADGENDACPWLPASVVTTTGAQLTYTLGDQPNQQWGTAASVAPWSLTTR